jgi:hypothetical protein
MVQNQTGAEAREVETEVHVRGWIASECGRKSFFYWCADCRAWHGHGWSGHPKDRRRHPHCAALRARSNALGLAVEIEMDPIGMASKNIKLAIAASRPPAGEADPGPIVELDEIHSHFLREVGNLLAVLQSRENFETRNVLDDIDQRFDRERLLFKICRRMMELLPGGVRRNDITKVYSAVLWDAKTVDEAIWAVFPYLKHL